MTKEDSIEEECMDCRGTGFIKRGRRDNVYHEVCHECRGEGVIRYDEDNFVDEELD